MGDAMLDDRCRPCEAGNVDWLCVGAFVGWQVELARQSRSKRIWPGRSSWPGVVKPTRSVSGVGLALSLKHI